MFKKMRLLGLSLVLILIVSIASSMGMAHGNQDQTTIENFRYGYHQDPVQVANLYLDVMEIAYRTENLPLFLNLYNDPVVAVDVVYNMNELLNTNELRDEVAPMFETFSDIKCTFADRQITSDGDMIMIRSMRSFTAKEFPMIAKCDMLMVIKKPFTHRYPWNYVATDQIMLGEEYLPLPTTDNVTNNRLTAPTIQAQQSAKKHHLIW